MEALLSDCIIKDSPIAVAILDSSLRLIGHSDKWLEEFKFTDDSLSGLPLLDILKEFPRELKDGLEAGLNGDFHESSGTRFRSSSGFICWYSWKINPWRSDDGSVGGVTIVMEDVTESNRQIDLLLRSENVARVGGWEVDLTRGLVHWSDVTREIHEVDKDFEIDLVKGINFYKEGADRELISQLVERAIKTGTPWDTELRIITAKGRELWVHAKGEAEIYEGECVRLFGTFADIDAKKRVELKQEKLLRRLELATKAAKIGIWEYNFQTGGIYWDEVTLEMYGLDKNSNASLPETWKRIVHPEDMAGITEMISNSLKSAKEIKLEIRLVHPGQEMRYVNVTGIYERDESGRAVRILGTIWDITELKKTRMELIRSEESFMGAFENSGIGMALVDLDGRWMKVNDSICHSLGYDREELLTLTFQDITHPDDLDKDLSLLMEVVAGKRDSYQIDKRYYHKNGRLVHIILTVSAVQDINGELTHFISQIMDISTRIEAQKRLKSLVDVTRGQNSSLLNFAHIVSHNLRSHASNLTMLTSFLDKEEDPQERKNIVQMLTNASNSLDETVEHLNEVVQVKTGALEQLKSVSLVSAVNSVEKNINALIKKNKAKCKIEIPKSHFVNVVPAYLDSILLNLFTNALKYRAVDRNPQLKIKSVEKGKHILLTFADNGQGIDMDRHRHKIFGMYKTFHKHAEAKGIGLFITKNQIESMNGTISVESEVDKGTIFTLQFEKG